jgi:hypothetical protein
LIGDKRYLRASYRLGISIAFIRAASYWHRQLQLTPFAIFRKDQKKVTKLEAQIPYHEGRGNKEEVEKIKEQIAGIWEKAKEEAMH